MAKTNSLPDMERLNKMLRLAADNPHSEESRTAAVKLCQIISAGGCYVWTIDPVRCTNTLADAQREIHRLKSRGLWARVLNL